MERLTKKVFGCFCYDLKDHKNVPGEFGDYDAFFDYNMAVKRLGEYEDTGLTPEECATIAKSKPKWISVEERLPEESYDGFSDDVLMLIEKPDGDKIWRDPYVGYYLYDACSDETGWWVKMTCDCTKVGEHKHGGKIYKENEYVTHWMPLPEPPKEE